MEKNQPGASHWLNDDDRYVFLSYDFILFLIPPNLYTAGYLELKVEDSGP